jgi:anaerobic selenocysteine-containing dehydrogenase
MRTGFTTLDLSRRGVLRAVVMAGAATAAVAVARVADAATKMSQKAAHYQDTPHGKARCDNCTSWAAPDGCKLVDGKIAAAGWCLLYAPKS